MTADSGRGRFAAAVTFAFLAVAGLGILRHEMWRDEMQAWMLAADSRSPAELLHNMRYEGHPALWHLLVFAISRFTRRPEAMQLLHLLVAAASVWLFARFAPFSARARALFAFGYFPLYEYGIISRNYALGVLLVLAFCAVRSARPRAWLAQGAILAALTQTNPYAWILSAVLATMAVFDGLRDAEARRAAASRPWQPVLAAALFAAAGGAAVLQMLPPADGGYAVGWRSWWDANGAVTVLATVAHADLPLPDVGSFAAWNTSLLWRLGYGPMAAVGVALIAAAAASLRRTPGALFLYLSGTAAYLAFTYCKYFGQLRHHGHHFLLLVACLWLAWGKGGSDRGREALLTGLLLVHLAAGAVLYSLDLGLPFSASKAAAEVLRANGLAAAPIAATQDNLVSPVSGYLGRPLYFLESRNLGRFILWNKQRLERLSAEETCNRLREWLARTGGATVLMSTRPPPTCGPELDMALVAEVPQGMAPRERYWVLVVRELAAGHQASAAPSLTSTAPCVAASSRPPRRRPPSPALASGNGG